MPNSISGSGSNSASELAEQVAQSDGRGPRTLTPEEMRLLAEKLYALLRADVRSMQARRQEPSVRR